ncbi:enolase C-terminal domain-like protein [Polynucleobacter sp. TSB-Sco08W16]|uniref:enolase C-terminal domain-like protein n=1 Tax=Polynucleobacter sp. TSB-Sco08W16 TaxID=1758374 RepID=UPI002739B53C|nr:enolase C-terminal domain-like protein [Polynucleobacter sp. TSB-Sco08W16]
MRIVDIREVAIPLNSSIRNAVFDFSEMTTSVVAVITDVIRDGKPIIGFAFNSTGRYACGAQMRDRLIPRIMKANPESLLNDAGNNLDPEKILSCMMQREKPGGHTERSVAVGTIEVAIWDAVAKIEGLPLHVTLANQFSGGKVRKEIPCYVGGGWYAPNKGIPQLLEEIQSRLDQGYTTMKIKVGGAPIEEDIARVEASLKIVGGGQNLAVDANAGLSPERAIAYAKALQPYQLRWFEEPTDPLDFALLAEIVDIYSAPIGTGENLFSTQDIRNLVQFGGLRKETDIIQIDIPQSYGIVQFSRTLKMLEDRGWGRHSIFPHGGNQMTLAIVAGFGLGGCEAYPGTFGVFAGFADDSRVANGKINLSERPGIGFEGQNALYEIMRNIV